MAINIPSSARNEALQVVLPFTGNLRERILALMRAQPIVGYTAEEAWEELRKTTPSLEKNNVRSRVTELFQAGQLFPKYKRPNLKGTVRITVWTITPPTEGA